MRFDDLLAFSSMTIHDLVTLTKRHPTTVRRWLRFNSAPAEIHHLVEILGHGRPASSSDEWSGWRFHRQWLYSPENVAVTPGEIRSLPLLLALRSEIDRLRYAPAQYLLDL